MHVTELHAAQLTNDVDVVIQTLTDANGEVYYMYSTFCDTELTSEEVLFKEGDVNFIVFKMMQLIKQKGGSDIVGDDIMGPHLCLDTGRRYVIGNMPLDFYLGHVDMSKLQSASAELRYTKFIENNILN